MAADGRRARGLGNGVAGWRSMALIEALGRQQQPEHEEPGGRQDHHQHAAVIWQHGSFSLFQHRPGTGFSRKIKKLG